MEVGGTIKGSGIGVWLVYENRKNDEQGKKLEKNMIFF